ncbi:NUDIX hydrolase [Clostridium tunisiense]|uniref:NUDIX hydrolase n=1 Tax=Clostridium tunisiense TaxID=219748 RepID=UPI00031D2806|nr:NUDIX pyrophosphatase [Clostridium tunisiense]
MVQRVNVQVFVFCKNPSFKVLILKRTPERSGYWQPVCGGVETGENFIETVLREVWEETGISNIKLIRDLEYTFEYEEPKNGVLMDMQDFCYAAEVEDIPELKLSEEHEEYKWCSYDEAKEYLRWEHNLIALEKLISNI